MCVNTCSYSCVLGIQNWLKNQTICGKAIHTVYSCVPLILQEYYDGMLGLQLVIPINMAFVSTTLCASLSHVCRGICSAYNRVTLQLVPFNE